MRKIFKWIFYFLLVVLVGVLIWVVYNNPYRQYVYEIELSIPDELRKVQYTAGFAKKMITPTVILLNAFYIVAWEVGVPALTNRMVMMERGILSIAEACIKLRLARFIFG